MGVKNYKPFQHGVIMAVAIVIPVYNEEEKLEKSVRKVLEFTKGFEPACRVTIADNASTDRTLEIAKKLSKESKRVSWVHLDEKGRGRALRKVWVEANTNILVYMDVDLATDLSAFPLLIHAVSNEGFDIAIGSRLDKGSLVKRSLKREVLSRGYNFLLKLAFNARFSDAQCGFKAIRKEVAMALLPKVQDNGWFFDTELLVRAQCEGFKLKNIPVRWSEGPDTKVSVLGDTISMGSSILKLRWALLKERFSS